MKASKFTGAQEAKVFKQGEEGTPVAKICRKAVSSQPTYFNWKKKCARADAIRDASDTRTGRREQPAEEDRGRLPRQSEISAVRL